MGSVFFTFTSYAGFSKQTQSSAKFILRPPNFHLRCQTVYFFCIKVLYLSYLEAIILPHVKHLIGIIIFFLLTNLQLFLFQIFKLIFYSKKYSVFNVFIFYIFYI